MPKLIMISLMLASLMAACAPIGETGEPSNESGVTPVTDQALDSYPPPADQSAYPAAPVQPSMPTGYPDVTVVAPSGEVDLANLTPVAPNLTPQIMPSPGRPDMTASPELTMLLEAVARDLNALTDAPVDEIRLVSAEPVVWPDGGLGCPAEGMNYAQVLVEGMLLTLEAAGETYTYHTSGMGIFVHCKDGQPISSGTVQG
jgi:hypothetical protein